MPSPPLRRFASLLGALALVVIAAGCGGGAELIQSANDDEPVDDVQVDDSDDTGPPVTAGTSFGDVEDRFVGDGIGEDDAVVLAALQDVESYWTDTFPAVFDDRFEPIEGGFHAYGPNTDRVPCGSPPPSYEDIADNAFFCPVGDLIAWDTDRLIPDLRNEFGDFALGIVMAHEYGHVIQERAGYVFERTIAAEQQADCWAGSWTRWVNDGDAENFDVSLQDLDAALAGFLVLRDALGTPSNDPGAHGSAFDRIGAFQDGYQNGAAVCAEYDDNNLEVVDIPFVGEADIASGGNAPYEEVEAFTTADLDGFWSNVFPEVFAAEWDEPDAVQIFPSEGGLPDCGGDEIDAGSVENEAFYCAPDDFVGWDEEELMPELYEEVGDFAMSTVIGNQYSRAAQIKAGNDGGTLEENLQADCFTGAWVASAVLHDRGDFDEENPDANPNANRFLLSPGDLDEAVIAFLNFADPAEEFEAGEGENGTAFLRLTAARTGFLAAIDAGDSVAGVEQCVRDPGVDID
jgi:predicted metalloprotease